MTAAEFKADLTQVNLLDIRTPREWDDFNLDNVLEKQYEVEKIILNTDWDDAARTLIKRKDEWHHLDYSGQDKFKSDFYGLSPDRYFLVAWD